MGELLSPQSVAVDGSVNFRDLGGYTTDDGRQVRRGHLFRCGTLSYFTQAGIDDFNALGVGLIFSQSGLDVHWSTSGFGSQLTWTLPFGLLIMFAVFNRFDKSYEEAARDLGATSWQTLRHVVLPIIGPSLIGVALFRFTLSYDEFARTLLTSGSYNTLPLEIFGMTTNVTTPVLYALGTLTTVFSLLMIGLFLCLALWSTRRKARAGSDAGKGML